MGSQEHLPLCWSSHQAEVLATFQQLLSEEAFVDVTLVCDGASLKAHKMILSACSPYFQNLFLENPCKHPIVIMKDVDYAVLKGIVDFMYHGGINLLPDQLSEFLNTAETLKVKGLSDIRKATELSSEMHVPPQKKTPHNVVNNSQQLNSLETDDKTHSQEAEDYSLSVHTRQQESNEDNEHYMADESNSFSIAEVKSEPESSDDVRYEETVVPDFSSSGANLSSSQYTVSVPHLTASKVNYNYSIADAQILEASSGDQQDIVMKETPPQFLDVSTQNAPFIILQNSSEDSHLNSNQYNTSSSQFISVHNSIPNASENQDQSKTLVPFNEPAFHSSDQTCENYNLRNPIIDGIAGILEQKSCILNKTTDIKPIVLQTFEDSTKFSSSNLPNQEFSSNPTTGLLEKGNSTVGKETGSLQHLTTKSEEDNNMHVTPKESRKSQCHDVVLSRRYEGSYGHCTIVASKTQRENSVDLFPLDKPFICDICHKRFSYRHVLIRHKIIHSGVRPFLCKTCGKTFTRKDHLHAHQLLHSRDLS